MLIKTIFLMSVADLVVKKRLKRMGIYHLYLQLNNEGIRLPNKRETSMKQVEYFIKKKSVWMKWWRKDVQDNWMVKDLMVKLSMFYIRVCSIPIKVKWNFKNLKIFKTFKSFLNKKDTTASTHTIRNLKKSFFKEK